MMINFPTTSYKAALALTTLIATIVSNPVVAQTCATDGSDYLYTETISTDGETREIVTTFCPNHPWSQLNPSPPIKGQTTYSVPAKPIYTGAVSADLTQQGGMVGVTFSGVMIFSPYGGVTYGQVTSQATSATVAEGSTFDQCGGHAASSTSASYHYHLAPPCLLQQLGQTSGSHSPQIGWAADGFPVYGPFGPSGTLMQTCTVTGGTYGVDVCTNDNGGYLLTDSTIDEFTFRYYFIGETNDGFQCGYVANTTPYPGSDESTYPNTPTGYYGCCPTAATCTASFLPACTSSQTTPGYTYTTATAAYPTGLSYNSNACDTAGGQTNSPSATPSGTPSFTPSVSIAPSSSPSTTPSMLPSVSTIPSFVPSISLQPSSTPSATPSNLPSVSIAPSSLPSATPSMLPSVSAIPSFVPSISLQPSSTPSATPSFVPSISLQPSSTPSATPTGITPLGDGVSVLVSDINDPITSESKAANEPNKRKTSLRTSGTSNDAAVASSVGNAPPTVVGKDGPKSANHIETKILTLQPHFTLLFFDGHQGDEPPSAEEISILWGRTSDFVDETLIEKYGIHFRGARVRNIIRESYQVQPHHQFELSFTLEITLDASTFVRGQVAGGLLTNKNNLALYVGKYVRFMDDDQINKNGLFYYTDEAIAKIIVKGMTNQRV